MALPTITIPSIQTNSALSSLSGLSSSTSLPNFSALTSPAPTPSLASLSGAGASLGGAISSAASLTSIGSVLAVGSLNPSIPSLPKLPGIPGLPVVALTCGQNETLAQLDNIRSNIIGLLSNKKAGLLALASQIPQVQGLLSQLQQKQELLFSLQNDLASLQASHYSPEAILAFANRWAGLIPNAQLQSILATINNSITSGSGLDICGSIPNLNINPVTNAVVQLASVSPTPNIAPIAAETLVLTVVDNTQLPSTGDSLQLINVLTDFNSKVRDAVQSQVWDPLQSTKDSFAKSLNNATKDASSAFAKVKKYGKDSKTLFEQNLLTTDEYSSILAYNVIYNHYLIFNKEYAYMTSWYWRAQEVINGVITQAAFDSKRKSLIEDPDFKSFIPSLKLTEDIINANKGLVMANYQYTNNKAAS